MNLTAAYIFRTLVCIATMLACHSQAYSRFHTGKDKKPATDTTRYPLMDRPGDPYTYPNRNTFDLRDTSYIKRNIEYDPKTKQYYIVEKVGTRYYRTPVSFSMQEFLKLQGDRKSVV